MQRQGNGDGLPDDFKALFRTPDDAITRALSKLPLNGETHSKSFVCSHDGVLQSIIARAKYPDIDDINAEEITAEDLERDIQADFLEPAGLYLSKDGKTLHILYKEEELTLPLDKLVTTDALNRD